MTLAEQIAEKAVDNLAWVVSIHSQDKQKAKEAIESAIREFSRAITEKIIAHGCISGSAAARLVLREAGILDRDLVLREARILEQESGERNNG